MLGVYHFEPRSLPEVAHHLGSLQYDPLRPLGRNPDLVLQARVAGYRENAWEHAAYRRRLLVDAWDKQACLTRVQDWPYRRLYHRHFRRVWGERVLDRYRDEVRATLHELERRGPLSSLDFGGEHRPVHLVGSWYGPKLVQHILRGLWLCGEVVTHHRDKGRHVYDVAARVLPPSVVRAPDPGHEASARRLLVLRVRAAGLLRLAAPKALWSIPIEPDERRRVLADLVADGELVRVEVDGEAYLAVPSALAGLQRELPRGMRFVAPLDGLLWDRRAVARLFGFDYLWEVYKPEAQRRWGYYVLPLWYGGELVGRIDGVREASGGESVWRVHAVSWEAPPRAREVAVFATAAARFARYLGVQRVVPGPRVDGPTRRALERAVPA